MKELSQHDADTVKELQSQIQTLERENRLLKERLEEAGISYTDIVAESDDEVIEEPYDPDQGARINSFEVTNDTAINFFLKFCRGRKDVYALRYTNPETKKEGYYTQCKNFWKGDCHRKKKDKVS